MFSPFAQLEKNLGRAGSVFSLAVACAIAASFVLKELQFEPALAVVIPWLAMPLVAWFMSKAAHAKGRSRWLYGLGSLLPPLAIFLFFSLSQQELVLRMEAGARRRDV